MMKIYQQYLSLLESAKQNIESALIKHHLLHVFVGDWHETGLVHQFVELLEERRQ